MLTGQSRYLPRLRRPVTTGLVAAVGASTGPEAVLFSYQGNTFLAIDNDNASGFTDAGDVLLRVNGVTGTLSADDFV